MKLSKSKTRVLISSSFAFILTLLLFLFDVCLGFSLGLFNDSSITRKINDSNYYNVVYDNFSKTAEDAVQKAGFPITVIKAAITFDRVYVNGKNYVNNELAGDKVEINTTKLHDEFQKGINDYFTEQKIVRTEEINKRIDSLISGIENEYKSSIELPFISYYRDYKLKFFNWMKIAIPLGAVVIAVLCFLLIKSYRYKHRGLRYINYAFIASSGMIFLTAAYLLMVRQYDKIKAEPDYYRNFLTAYLKWDIMVFLYIGGIGLTISLILISLTGYLRNKGMNS